MRLIGCWLLVALTGEGAVAQTERNWYTPERLAVARENIADFEWAAARQRAILTAARHWAAYDDAKLRTLVVPPAVPRAYDIHQLGCPVHGQEANRSGLYKWGIDFDRPFQIVCPAGGEVYPSNDFAAFLASGLTDRSLLTGGTPDDGWGWQKPGEDKRYFFVAYYAHWSMLRFMLPAIENLSQASLLADDPAERELFAHKCALLLWQLAVHYPDYEYEKQSREGIERPSYTGRITNVVWEIGIPNTCGPAYDAIRPHLPADTALHKLSGLGPAALDEFIRERLLRCAAVSVMDTSGRIRGNYGMHQSSLVTLAMTMNEETISPTSAEMIAWVLANPEPQTDACMGVYDALENLVYRDGVPQESPSYNLGWVRNLTDVAVPLATAGHNLFAEPRFTSLLAWPFDMTVAGRFMPPLGDTGNLFAIGDGLPASICAAVWPYLPDPRLATVLHASPRAGRDLFQPPLILPEATEPVDYGRDSHLFPAYGLAILQAGPRQERTAAALSFGSWTHHMHHDQLNLLLFGHGNTLLCDVGYPEQTDPFNPRRFGWWNNTSCHNTVVVDARKQRRGPSRLWAYDSVGWARLTEASAEAAYPGTAELYRRATALVDLDDERSYVLDLFHVAGGQQHDLVCMGPQAEFTSEPPLGPTQTEGTLAGPEVPFERFYDDPNLIDKAPGTVSYTGYTGSGFQFLRAVRRRPLAGGAVGQWRLTEPLPGQPQRRWEGVGLRAHLLGDDEEMIAAEGAPQGYSYLPETVTFMLRRRLGEPGLRSRYVTVFEPYQRDEQWVTGTALLAVTPEDPAATAVAVTFADGRRHLLFHSLDPTATWRVAGEWDFSGQFGAVALNATGQPERAVLLNGRLLRGPGLELTGPGQQRVAVAAVDYQRRRLTLAEPVANQALSSGELILVEPEGFAEALTVGELVSPTEIQLADGDLRVGGGAVRAVNGDRLETNVSSPFAQPGMTVTNSRGEPVARLLAGPRHTLSRSVALSDFPQAQPDYPARFAIAVVGPGDTVVIPCRREWRAQAAE